MKFFNSAAAICVLFSGALAFPGMKDTINEVCKREGQSGDECGDSTELIGDLEWLQEHELSKVGSLVRKIILGSDSGETDDAFHDLPPPLQSSACAQDTCCVWRYIAGEMEQLFRGPSGRCTDSARAAIRLGFHDAAGWSKHTGPGGGADGSIVLAPEEITRPDNRGLEEIIHQMKIWHDRWGGYGVSMADLIQMASTVATVVCPLGPRIRSFVGRRDSDVPCPDGLLPNVFSDANTLIELFRAKTIQPHGLTALIGAHSTSQQRFVDPSRAGDPQDSTPGVWDVAFYKETLGDAPPRVFKFHSDIVLSQDPRISSEFHEFAGKDGQKHWNSDYAREYVRLSLLGVYNINNLTDCTRVLPAARRGWKGADDQWAVDLWTNTTVNVPEIANELQEGKSINNIVTLLTPAVEKVQPVVEDAVRRIKRAFWG